MGKKVVGDRVTYEKGECKEIEVCKAGYYVPRFGHYGKRAADADASFVECEKEMKEVCKQVPVKTPVEKDVEVCVSTPREDARKLREKFPRSPAKASNIKKILPTT